MKFGNFVCHKLPIVILIVGSLFYGCDKKQDSKTRTELARFEGEVLTLEEIIIPKNLSQQDSIEFVKKQTNEWLIRQAYAKKAFENIDDKDQILEQKINEYKKTLYIHEYKQRLLEQKIDTIVSLRQIEDYYNKYGDEFRLTNPLIKAWVIIVPVSMPNLNQLMQYLHSDNESVIGDLKELCFSSARYYNFNDDWRPLHNLLNETSLTAQTINNDNIYKGKIFSIKRNEIELLIKINNHLKTGDKPPIESVSKQIKEIIIQKRKELFFNRLENELLQSVSEQNK